MTPPHQTVLGVFAELRSKWWHGTLAHYGNFVRTPLLGGTSDTLSAIAIIV